MSILDDIKRLHLELNENDNAEINAILDRVAGEGKEEFVQAPLTEYLLEEYLTVMRPDILSALREDRNSANAELMKGMGKRYDQKGDRLCDEPLCSSTESVAKCGYCDRFICKSHNYGKDSWCCYACWKEQGGEE